MFHAARDFLRHLDAALGGAHALEVFAQLGFVGAAEAGVERLRIRMDRIENAAGGGGIRLAEKPLETLAKIGDTSYGQQNPAVQFALAVAFDPLTWIPGLGFGKRQE